VGEAAEDSASNGAPEWWWFTYGGGVLRWCGLTHRDDFNRFVIFVYNSDHDCAIFFLFGDSFFSFPLTW
jgi:hypothetical protein